VGVDYVPEMVSACKNRFAHERYEIMHGDARHLRGLDDEQFDLVLFSHNGLDCVTHEDRLRVLGEIHRVSRRGAWFCFSSHNLGRAPDLLGGKRRGLGRLLDALLSARIRANNPEYGTWFARPHATLRDGAYGFRLVSYHIRAMAQVAQLRDAGFADVRVFSLSGGEEIALEEAQRSRDPWLYYLARRR
jgi:ubiquinone/menaquinone biosynthesis C-methylase UbiE